MAGRRLIICVLYSLLAFSLVGCPLARVAYIDIYNNTKSDLLLNSHGKKEIIKPDHSVQAILGCSFQIESELGTWYYPRNVPRDGHKGPYFDGTIRVQINQDGVIYALKTDETVPLTSFSEQPQGYPLYGESPRLAYIDIYNNTKAALLLNSQGEKKTVEPEHSVRMRLGCFLKIESELGGWYYPRKVPHGWNKGPYFDGIVRVQVNQDGVIYALKTDETAPLTSFSEQPQGYPIHAAKYKH